jgi:hypothetical protein
MIPGILIITDGTILIRTMDITTVITKALLITVTILTDTEMFIMDTGVPGIRIRITQLEDHRIRCHEQILREAMHIQQAELRTQLQELQIRLREVVSITILRQAGRMRAEPLQIL